MPKYEVEVDGLGKFEVESEKPLSEAQILEAVKGQAEQRQGSGSLSRQLGLTARAGVTGTASLPLLAGDALNTLINMIMSPVTDYRLGMPSQGAQQLLTKAGLPEPQTSTERVVQDIASAVSGVGGTAKLASRLAPGAATAPLTERLGLQTTGAVGGAAAAGTGREMGATNPLAQLGLAALGGTVAPATLGQTAQQASRGAVAAVRPFTEAGREVVAGQVLRNLAREPELAAARAERFTPSVPGYRPTTAQATRDPGLIAAETSIRSMDTGQFMEQASAANRARMNILDRLARDKDALDAAILKRDEVTGPLREQAFARSTVSPETFQSSVALTVNKTIDDILKSSAGARSSVEKTMNWAKEQITRGTDPTRLYEVRKDLRDAAQGLLDKEGAAYSLAKTQLEQVIRSVDDAIDAAAPGYKDYLSKYATASRGIERLEAAQSFRSKVLSTTPDPSNIGDYLISQPAFTRAIRAAKADPELKGLSKTQLAVLDRVSQDLDSGVLARAGKPPGSDTFKNMSTANVIGGIIGKQMYGEMSPFLSKVAAPMNWLYNGTDDKIRELLVEAMLDPKLASRLMSKASVTTMEPLSQELQRKAINMGYGSIFGLE